MNHMTDYGKRVYEIIKDKYPEFVKYYDVMSGVISIPRKDVDKSVSCLMIELIDTMYNEFYETWKVCLYEGCDCMCYAILKDYSEAD